MKVGHRFSHQSNHSNTFISKGLQNRQTNLFQLFNNVPELPTQIYDRQWRHLTRNVVERISV